MGMLAWWLVQQNAGRAIESTSKRNKNEPQLTCVCGAKYILTTTAQHKRCVCDRCGRTMTGSEFKEQAVITNY